MIIFSSFFPPFSLTAIDEEEKRTTKYNAKEKLSTPHKHTPHNLLNSTHLSGRKMLLRKSIAREREREENIQFYGQFMTSSSQLLSSQDDRNQEFLFS